MDSADRMIALQVAVVERARAIIAFRAAERGRPGPTLVEAGARLAASRQALDAARAGLPIDQMGDALELDDLDREALGLIAAPHLDDSLRQEIRAFRDEPRGYVDVALLCELLCSTSEQAIRAARRYRADGILAGAGLIELVPPALGRTPSLLEHEAVPTPRLLGILGGMVALDKRTAECGRLLPARPGDADGVVPIADQLELFALMRAACGAAHGARGAKLLITGAAGGGKVRLASAFAASGGLRLALVVEATLLPRHPVELIHMLHRLDREALMHGALLVLRNIEAVLGDADRADAITASLARLANPVVITSERDDLPTLDPLITLRFELPRGDVALRAEAWRAELGVCGLTEVSGEKVLALSASYPLPRARIATAVELAVAMGGAAALERCAATQVRSQLARYAEKSTSHARLDDLVLPDEVCARVRELINAVKVRPRVMEAWGFGARLSTGRGIVAMFNGPSGTGKTFAAGVIANELGLPMYRVDVSKIVDRFVGETEKNLRRLFDEAGTTNAMLLFDEADSLFGRRTSTTKDAVDRHANMQINLLLNLIEDYEGFVVLTTNLKGAIDTAFMRRIAYKVTFDVPDTLERAALWRKHLPGSVPLAADVDLDRLARDFTTSGAEIKNAVLRAALLAGGEGCVSEHMLRHAVREEMEASGRVVNRSPAIVRAV